MSEQDTQAPSLHRDAFGRLVLVDGHGTAHAGVVAVRAFPIHAPDECISVLDADGRELAWVAHLPSLPEPARTLLAEALQQREFMPTIVRLRAVSGFVTPCTWQVDTDRGAASFVLKGEEDIRRLGAGLLIVSDEFGVQYLIRDVAGMDRQSRKLLDRFL